MSQTLLAAGQKVADYASKKDDRWLMIALLVVVLSATGLSAQYFIASVDKERQFTQAERIVNIENRKEYTTYVRENQTKLIEVILANTQTLNTIATSLNSNAAATDRNTAVVAKILLLQQSEAGLQQEDRDESKTNKRF